MELIQRHLAPGGKLTKSSGDELASFCSEPTGSTIDAKPEEAPHGRLKTSEPSPCSEQDVAQLWNEEVCGPDRT